MDHLKTLWVLIVTQLTLALMLPALQHLLNVAIIFVIVLSLIHICIILIGWFWDDVLLSKIRILRISSDYCYSSIFLPGY